LDTIETQAAKDTILRAWKDEEYRQSLPEDVRAAIPARPEAADGGAVLSDEQLETAAGAGTPLVVFGAAKVGGALFGKGFASGAGTAAGAGTVGYIGGKASGLID
jgi:mersacidin/lichenicidin family type 2 lantibiotic